MSQVTSGNSPFSGRRHPSAVPTQVDPMGLPGLVGGDFRGLPTSGGHQEPCWPCVLLQCLPCPGLLRRPRVNQKPLVHGFPWDTTLFWSQTAQTQIRMPSPTSCVTLAHPFPSLETLDQWSVGNWKASFSRGWTCSSVSPSCTLPSHVPVLC